MAKGNEKKYQRTNIETGASNSNKAYSDFLRPVINRAPTLYDAGQKERGNLLGGYQSFADTGGFSDEDAQRLRDTYNQNIGAAPQANLQDFSKERAGYTDFADTGGYTGADIQRVRSQAARSAPTLFSAMKNQYELNKSNKGYNANANTGFDFKSMRSAAQQSAQDKTSANIGLTDSINAGKLQGLSGLTGIDTTMGNQSLSNASIMANYNAAKASGASDVEARILAMKQSGKEFGLSGLNSMYGQDYAPSRNNQNDWLNAIGAGDASQRGWQGLNLQNDEINKSSIWGNIGKGFATAGSFLSNLFKKNKSGVPTGGTGSGGGDPQEGWKFDDSLFRGGWGNPADPSNPAGDIDPRNFPSWEKSANPGESFIDWYHRTQGKSGVN